LVWSATEGGTYRVESTAALPSGWTTNAQHISATFNHGMFSGPTNGANNCFRVIRSGLGAYDTN